MLLRYQIFLLVTLFASAFGTLSLSEIKASYPRDLEQFPDAVMTDEWIIKFAEGENIETLTKALNLRITDRMEHLNIVVVSSQEMNTASKEETHQRLATLFANQPQILWAERNAFRTYTKCNYANETGFPQQWHLRNTGQRGGTPGQDVNIIPVWERGILGAKTQICIVDDGLEYTHPDLSQQYVAADSYDYIDGDADPFPVGDSNHGTACAGVAAARDDGTFCGVGASYRARLSGVRVLGGGIYDSDMARAVSHNIQNNDIFSCSWSYRPCDTNGCTLTRIGRVIIEAFQHSAQTGRGGKGSIYVFSAGNNRALQSNVNYRDIPRQKYTIPVAAHTDLGQVSPYSDPGAALHIAAPSNGGFSGIYTTDRLAPNGYNPTGNCTSGFSGTSSACPLVAGVIGLMLDANPDLTWRDVQDILAVTARKIDPDSPEWQTNGAGFHVSHDFGFGAIDADAAVTASIERGYHLTCQDNAQTQLQRVNIPIPDNNLDGIQVRMTVSGIENIVEIEHTFVTVTISHPFRGNLGISLVSPSGNLPDIPMTP